MSNTNHYVAIFGGAVSGAEAASQLTSQGIRCAVFEQNLLPYGKIEDGLPKWHVKLRDKELARIDEKLSHPLVDFVPGVRLGREVSFTEIAREWGFSAVLLATGAWRDRPLPVDGVDEYVDRGLVYQNPYFFWFNHFHEPNYDGPVYPILDGTVVIGGGLASIDVVKALMILTVEQALRERGIMVHLFDLERSIKKVLDQHGLTLTDLGLKGCSLYYRRRVADMPLTPMETDTPEKQAKAELVRKKVLDIHVEKYLFSMHELEVPVDKVVEDDRLVGLIFQKTQIVEGRAKAVFGTDHELRAPMFISSIGSIPEQIDGIPLDGQVYKVHSEDCCRIDGFNNVFALGNAVTGRGNIRESMIHGRAVANEVMESHMAQPVEFDGDRIRKAEAATQLKVGDISGDGESFQPLTDEAIKLLETRIRKLQAASGYDGDYRAWVKRHTPPRLEELLGIVH